MDFGDACLFIRLHSAAFCGAMDVGLGLSPSQKNASAVLGRILERVWPKSVRWRRAVRAVLLVSALFLLILALAEPRYGKRVHLFEQKGVDMVLILDLSTSMMPEMWIRLDWSARAEKWRTWWSYSKVTGSGW